MALKEYAKKRKFNETLEPSILKKMPRKSSEQLIFTVHEHHATHLHWDLRLQMNGVLKSWAVPKVPPIAKGTKRLAIQVEDHPLDYSAFQGVIPEGNYGAGEVKIWDSGKYDLIERTPGKIIFEPHGKKLKGRYCLIKNSYGGKKNNWLFFKI